MVHIGSRGKNNVTMTHVRLIGQTMSFKIHCVIMAIYNPLHARESCMNYRIKLTNKRDAIYSYIIYIFILLQPRRKDT